MFSAPTGLQATHPPCLTRASRGRQEHTWPSRRPSWSVRHSIGIKAWNRPHVHRHKITTIFTSLHTSVPYSTLLLLLAPLLLFALTYPLARQVDPVTLTRHPHLTAARPTPSPAPSIPVPLVLTPPCRPTISPPSTIRVFSCPTACARTPAERRPQILLVDTCSLVVRFTVYLSLFNFSATRCLSSLRRIPSSEPQSISGYRQRLARSTLNLIIP